MAREEKKNSASSVVEVKYHFLHRLLSSYQIDERDGEGKLKNGKGENKSYNWNCSGINVQ